MKTTIVLITTLICLMAALMANAQEQRQPSATDCDFIAERAAKDAGGMGDGRIARGAARGAVIGGVLGRSKGAKRGAALGVIAGWSYQSLVDTQLRRHGGCFKLVRTNST